jgi:hypothetical protein
MNSVAMPQGLPEDELDIQVEKTYSPYSTQPQHNKGVGTYFSTTADMKNLRYDFRSVSSLSPVWLDLKQLDFSAGQPTRHITDMHLYGSQGWIGDLQARQAEPCLRIKRAAGRPARRRHGGSAALGHQGQDVVAGHQLAVLVADLHVPGHHALAHALGVLLLAVDLALGRSGARGWCRRSPPA